MSSLFNYVEISTAFPWFFPSFVFLFGACVGSFLNVVIYRLPKKESVVTPGSHCGCGQPIAWYDNIPVLSWLLLRGKARCCGRRFSFRYAAIELLTAGLFLWCWLGHTPAVALCGFVFLSCLIAATFIDLDTFEIPDIFTIGLGVVGVLLAGFVPDLHGHGGDNPLLGGMRSGITALQGLLIGSAVVLWIGLIAEILLKKDAMGFGDVTFVGAIGAFCGWQGALFTIFGGAVVGTVWVVISLGIQKITGRRAAIAPPSETPEGEKTDLGLGAHVPFGPMLAIAGGLYFLAFRPLVLEWFAQFTEIF